MTELSNFEPASPLEAKLAAFKNAGDNLQINPLLTRVDLAKLGVAYQEDLVAELESAIEDCTEQDNKFIFTGHRGCGKSTLLAELGFRLTETQRYFVVSFAIGDTIAEYSAVDHVNILFSIALQLIEAAERRSVELKPELKKGLYRWLGKHTQTESKTVEAAIETGGKASLKGGIPTLLDFIADIKSVLRVNSIVREEITTEFERKTADLIAQVNLIQSYIFNATGLPIVVIIDDLDKLDLSVAEAIFRKNIRPLLGPAFRVIYTLPIATLREVSLKRLIEGYVKRIYTMRVAKFFSKAEAHKAEPQPNPETLELCDQILEKRMDKALIDPAIRQTLILKSGGVLRELIRITDLCTAKCRTKIRRQIRTQQWDGSPIIIDAAILTEILTDLQLSYAESLGLKDFRILEKIYREFKLEDTENQRELDLLHGLYVLEYRNALQWYDLNPIVRDLLIAEGMIDGDRSQ